MRIAFDVKLLLNLAGGGLDTLPSPASLEALVREQFAFLPRPIQIELDGWTGVITCADATPAAVAESQRLGARASRRASEGDYDKAIRLWRRVVELEPTNTMVRRDLAMALVEQNKAEEAKDQLIDALRVEPDDVHSLVVLANLYVKHEDNLPTAERLLTHALAVKAADPWVLNSLAALRLQQGRVAESMEVLERCIAVAPSFANPHLGMAMALAGTGRTEEATQTLERLFQEGRVQDTRSLPIFREAREMYASLMTELTLRQRPQAAEAVEVMKRELATVSGYEIRVQAGEIPTGSAATIQMAWKYQRDHHLIVFRKEYPEHLLLHLTAHELGHLRLESAARARSRNRLFVSTAANRERAIRSTEKDVARWQREGLSEEAITQLTQQLIDGMALQLLNTPIDMLVEEELRRDVPALHASQFVSLALLAREAEGALAPKVRAGLPRHLVRASTALNGATALFLDALYGGATAYAAPYRGYDQFSVSERLFALLSERKATLGPGDEYEIVDAWAEVLGLQGWYEWRPDDGEGAALDAGGPTEDEGLRERHPAAVWYLLGALERFQRMTDEEIRAISFEIAAEGMGGLDYTSPEQTYTLKSLPGETFSGLQLMCFMYAGFAQIAPDQDTGMDLQEPFQVATQLHEERKRPGT